MPPQLPKRPRSGGAQQHGQNPRRGLGPPRRHAVVQQRHADVRHELAVRRVARGGVKRQPRQLRAQCRRCMALVRQALPPLLPHARAVGGAHRMRRQRRRRASSGGGSRAHDGRDVVEPGPQVREQRAGARGGGAAAEVRAAEEEAAAGRGRRRRLRGGGGNDGRGGAERPWRPVGGGLQHVGAEGVGAEHGVAAAGMATAACASASAGGGRVERLAVPVDERAGAAAAAPQQGLARAAGGGRRLVPRRRRRRRRRRDGGQLRSQPVHASCGRRRLRRRVRRGGRGDVGGDGWHGGGRRAGGAAGPLMLLRHLFAQVDGAGQRRAAVARAPALPLLGRRRRRGVVGRRQRRRRAGQQLLQLGRQGGRVLVEQHQRLRVQQGGAHADLRSTHSTHSTRQGVVPQRARRALRSRGQRVWDLHLCGQLGSAGPERSYWACQTFRRAPARGANHMRRESPAAQGS